MAQVLMPATSLYGHVRPVTQIGRMLADRGHQVIVLTGATYRGVVERAGLGFRALPDEVDLSRLGKPSGRVRRRPRWAEGRDAILSSFVHPLRRQAESLDRALADLGGCDMIISDVAFLGIQPLLLGGADARPPVIGISATPLSVTSVDCAPFGTAQRPWPGVVGRMRNRQIDWLLRHGPLRPVQHDLDDAVAAFGVPAGRADYADAVLGFDHVFHLGLRELEYPRRELPDRIEFVGPLPAESSRSSPADLLSGADAGEPIIHVSQGTFDNLDHDRLIVPTLRALADEECRVVVSTGGRPVEDLRSMIDPWPRNVCVTDFVDYARLLPRTEIMITNGGYGGVQLAARYGVPLIVAGETEEKPEVAARVAWAGVGIDLRTGRPRPDRIRRAVRTLRTDDRFRWRAAQIRASAERLPAPLVCIAERVEAMITPARPPEVLVAGRDDRAGVVLQPGTASGRR